MKVDHLQNIAPTKPKAGFSLLELMIVVAIIGILSSIAAPAYRDYVIKSRVAELVSLANPYQQVITQAYTQGTIAPGVGGALNIPGTTSNCLANPSKYVANVCLSNTANNTLVILSGNVTSLGINTGLNINLVMIGNYNSTTDIMDWTCGYDTATGTAGTYKYLPSGCTITSY